MLIQNGSIHDALHKTPFLADIRICNGKITEIGTALLRMDGEETVEAGGLHVYPGMVDAHSHVGLSDYAMGEAGQDHNEIGDPLVPHLRAIDSFYPQDDGLRRAYEAGVTTVCVGPGSANVLNGTFLVTKTYGACADEMVIKHTAAMKCALGENPKAANKGKGCTTRMGTAAKLREALFNAKEYADKKNAANKDIGKMPKYDMRAEALLPLLAGEIPLKVHAHRADDICTALRIAREFDLKLTIEHCTEGHLVVEQLQHAGCSVAVGPLLSSGKKNELLYKRTETAAILSKAGVPVCIISDAPVTPQESLALSAGLAVGAGMDPFLALQAITIQAARHVGVADRVGTLEVGKDADILLTDGDLLLGTTGIKAVFLNGKQIK